MMRSATSAGRGRSAAGRVLSVTATSADLTVARTIM